MIYVSSYDMFNAGGSCRFRPIGGASGTGERCHVITAENQGFGKFSKIVADNGRIDRIQTDFVEFFLKIMIGGKIISLRPHYRRPIFVVGLPIFRTFGTKFRR